jgi:radical SAM superfamily enzyme YgiQ (UPF0313 family)
MGHMPSSGRNDPCPCGSGRKFKKCHGASPKASVGPRALPARGLVAIRPPQSAQARASSEERKRCFTAPGAKKLVLAYAPYSTVTTPPLGVAYLKGYVQRMLADWSVELVDLNLEAHQEFFERLAEQPMLRSPKYWPEGKAGERDLARAAETFRGAHPEEFYGDGDRMVHYSLLWHRALRGSLHRPTEYAMAFHGRAPMPAEIERQAARLLARAPTAIGISACYVEQFWASLCLARAIRARDASMPILLGGTMFKEGIEDTWNAATWPVDYIVGGAGELPLVEILAGRAESGLVPGVTLVDGRSLRSTPPDHDADFTAIGDADFSDFDPRAYYSPEPIFPIQTSRGCFWKRCTFCNHYRTVGGAYQLRTVRSVIEELARHAAAGVRHFTFVDDIIAPSRFNQISQAILDAGLNIRYHAMTRPVKQLTGDVLQRMYDAGCRFVLWGVESGSQRVLDSMEKGTVVADVERCLELAARAGIKNHVFIMCGFPTETREEFGETIDLLRRARPSIHRVHKTMFGLERGTPVFDNPEKFSITRMWLKRNTLLYGFETSRGMTREEAKRALDEARPFFRSFATGKELELGDFRFRDHMLLLYSRDDRVDSRQASRVPLGTPDAHP